MSGTLAVYQKELSTYFRSPIAYFVVAVFLVGTGYFFTYNIFLTGNATMAETFQNMGILLLLVIPVVSMRLFSAEYGAGTMELLQTLPLEPRHITVCTVRRDDDVDPRFSIGAAIAHDDRAVLAFLSAKEE